MKKSLPLILLTLIFSCKKESESTSLVSLISTFAGNGYETSTYPSQGGYSGDGGAATAAALNSPSSLAIDTHGNIYISDFENNRIRKVSNTGIITTIAGNGIMGYSGDGGLAINAEIALPIGIAVDRIQRVYIADGNYRVRMVDTNGIITTIAGNGNGGDSGDGGPATVARISTPFGIAIDSTNNVYFSDYDNRKIKKIDTNGIISTIAGNGQTGFGGDGGPATNATFFNPSGIAIDRAGNIYIADGENHRIRIINSLGIISTFAGNGNSGHSGDGGLASDAEINSPFAVTSDIEGNIYIGDASDYRVRKVNSVRTISTVAGTGVYGYSGDGGPATAAKLNGPAGLVTDLNHNLYIADENNNRIRKVNNR